MAKKLYDIRNYPRNAGTSQPGRYNASLMGDNVAIIEQNIADYIVFAHKLSHYLKYYNDRNEEAGNWQNFLTNDVSYHLAVIAAEKPKLWNEAWGELMENVEATDTTRKNENKKYYTWRFDFLYTLIGRLVDAFIYSKELPQWENDLKALYTTANLNIIYDLLEKYNRSSKDLLVTDGENFFYKDLSLSKRTAVVTSIETNNSALSGILSTDDPLIPNGNLIFGDIEASDIVDRINAASEYLDDLAQQLLRLYARVHDLSETHLQLSLTSFDAHQPHIGLFYAFLQLLQEHKTDINSLLLKHLEFYYKEVLSVKLKPYQPSKAYVTFELPKNVNEFLIKTGSSLSAGKDAKGKDIFYKTQQDIVVNKAVTGDIKSFTLLKNKDGVNERKKSGEPLGIFACAKADSSDGKEKPLQPGESWNPFRVSSIENDLDAQIGISFYSSLALQAPTVENTFQLVITFKNSIGLDKLKSFVESYGTIKIFTEKESLISSFSKVDFLNNQLTIEFKIPEKTKIKKTAPNLSLVFGRKNSTITDDFFATLKALQTVEVASFSLTLSNQTIPVSKVETVLGMTDLSASFPAFGGVPKIGSSFKIIEPILKGKKVSGLSIEVEWASATERSFNVSVSYPGSNSYTENIDNGRLNSSIDVLKNIGQIQFGQGELKIKLESDLGHLSYGTETARVALEVQGARVPDGIVQRMDEIVDEIKEIEDYIKRGAHKHERGIRVYSSYSTVADYLGRIKGKVQDIANFGLPSPPYTPVIKKIDLVCSVTENIGNSNLFYQYPHGYKTVDAQSFWIVPSTPCEGELYIGFKGLAQAQSLNVLIQVEEGSSDPTLEKPKVTWAFLHNNNWQNFDPAQFKDGTNGLIQSGIVSFVSPGFDCLTNTLLPAGQFWIRADVKFNETKATCKIFSVNTQAVLSQFIDSGNDAASLGSNLPANSITQLFPKQSSVKKVVQPYASFGGRLEEENKKLYIRTSERLRHKGRAVNAWDYEHIITEAFPEIYKAKVLNHAHLKIENDEKIIVSKAGEMIILVIGKTAAQSSLYKPLVSKSKLTEITDFITQLNSPFAKINVMNPLFEEVTIDTIVTFRPHIKDEAFYEKELQKDINRFLSPWAFENGVEPDFGGVIYRAALLDFIEELSYIDFVEKLEIRHQNNVTGDVATASSPASILVSASMHIVDGNLTSSSEINSSINDPLLAN